MTWQAAVHAGAPFASWAGWVGWTAVSVTALCAARRRRVTLRSGDDRHWMDLDSNHRTGLSPRTGRRDRGRRTSSDRLVAETERKRR